MATIQVSLPESLREFVETEVQAGKYSDASEYLSQLVREEWNAKERERIRRALLDGLASGPPVEMTPEMWRQFRAEINPPKP